MGRICAQSLFGARLHTPATFIALLQLVRERERFIDSFEVQNNAEDISKAFCSNPRNGLPSGRMQLVCTNGLPKQRCGDQSNTLLVD